MTLTANSRASASGPASSIRVGSPVIPALLTSPVSGPSAPHGVVEQRRDRGRVADIASERFGAAAELVNRLHCFHRRRFVGRIVHGDGIAQRRQLEAGRRADAAPAARYDDHSDRHVRSPQIRSPRQSAARHRAPAGRRNSISFGPGRHCTFPSPPLCEPAALSVSRLFSGNGLLFACRSAQWPRDLKHPNPHHDRDKSLSRVQSRAYDRRVWRPPRRRRADQTRPSPPLFHVFA